MTRKLISHSAQKLRRVVFRSSVRAGFGLAGAAGSGNPRFPEHELHVVRIILREKSLVKTTLYISHETDLSQVRVDYHSPFGCNWN